jgi:hypothetical protein
MITTPQAARYGAAHATPTAKRPSARAPRPLLALADMPANGAVLPADRARTITATLLETERRIRAAGIVRLHCMLAAADGHAVRLAGERRAAPVVYGVGADLAEAMADLFRSAAKDGVL